MSSISVFARQAMEIVVNDVKKDFKLEKVVKSVIAAAKKPKPPKIDRKKEELDRQKKEYEKKRTQLVMQIAWYFDLKPPVDNSVITRVLAYFLVKFSTSAGDGYVRLKVDGIGKKRLKPYNPRNYFHRKKYEPQSDAASLLAFDCEQTQKDIIISLRDSLLYDGVLNSNSDRKFLSTTHLRTFEVTYQHQLKDLFS